MSGGEDFATFKGHLGLESLGGEGGGIGIVEVGLCQPRCLLCLQKKIN